VTDLGNLACMFPRIDMKCWLCHMRGVGWSREGWQAPTVNPLISPELATADASNDSYQA